MFNSFTVDSKKAVEECDDASAAEGQLNQAFNNS